jgi:hypothetical protein
MTHARSNGRLVYLKAMRAGLACIGCFRTRVATALHLPFAYRGRRTSVRV